MFKRIEKRIRKKEKEEELGLDADTKETLGIHDTDSDESASSSSSEEERDDEGASGAEEDEEAESGDMDEAEDEEEEEAESSSGDDEPHMSVSEALQDPLYVIEDEHNTQGCIVCPGKLLKNPVMIDVHLKSGVCIHFNLLLHVPVRNQPKLQAHKRRFDRFKDAAMSVDAKTDARDVLRALLVVQGRSAQADAPEDQMSKRAEKRVCTVSSALVRIRVMASDSPPASHSNRKQSRPQSRRSAQNKKL